MTERLTTLANLKDWLEITSDDNDASLTRLIEAASQFTLNYLNRDSLSVQEYTENFRGNGKETTLLRNWPVTDIDSVGINGQLVTSSTLGVGGKPSHGYTISDRRNGPQSLDLWGYCYLRGAPCQVIYSAGYETTQTSNIPADPYQIIPTAGGVWSADVGVTIDGVTATKVDDSPATGEYSVDEWGTYTFAAADTGKEAKITYSYTPADLSQAVVEMIGNWYVRKDRIGVLSKTLGGQETITYSSRDMTDTIRSAFQNYKNEIPV